MTTNVTRRLGVVATLTLIAGLALAGCSAPGPSGGAAPEGAPTVPAVPNAPAPANPNAPKPQDPATGGTDRLIARTATATLVADDVAKAVQSLHELATGLGGWVANESISLPEKAGTGGGSASVQLSVPSASLDQAFTQMATLGRVTDQATQSEDVTNQVVDTESRIATMRASIARLQDLIKQSGSVSDIAAVEAQLTQREADLESLLALQKSLSQRVQTATITVSVRTPSTVEESNGFVAALQAGWEALGTAAQYLVIVVGALLPWLALAAVIIVPIVLVRRRWRASGKLPPKTPRVRPVAWVNPMPPAQAPTPPAPQPPVTAPKAQ